jgi:hypothetical protein
MMFNIEWVIQNPIQTIDKGVSVIFDSEPILLAATIITFCIVAFFVWNKNKIKLYKMVEDRKPMEPVKFDREDILELKSALGKATISEDVRSPVKLSERPFAKGQVPPKERTKTSGEAEIDGVSDSNELTRAVKRDVLSSKADEPRYDEFRERGDEKMENLPVLEKIDDVGQDNRQHVYEEEKPKETPRERMKRLWKEGKLKGRPKRLEKARREVPEKP